MSENRFRITTNPKSNAVAFDEKQKKHYIGIDLENLLNEQDKKIDEMAETNEILNEYIHIGDELDKEKLEVLKDVETEIKLLNSYLVERGLAEEYIRWKGDDDE